MIDLVAVPPASSIARANMLTSYRRFSGQQRGDHGLCARAGRRGRRISGG